MGGSAVRHAQATPASSSYSSSSSRFLPTTLDQGQTRGRTDER